MAKVATRILFLPSDAGDGASIGISAVFKCIIPSERGISAHKLIKELTICAVTMISYRPIQAIFQMKVKSTTTSEDCIGEQYQLMRCHFVHLTLEGGLRSKGVGEIRAERPAIRVEC
jgi:hypothetical protein